MAQAQSYQLERSNAGDAFAVRASAQRKLNDALVRIANDPRNGYAQLDAGEAALALNDATAAYGFLSRAAQLLPTNARVNSALGATFVAMQNPGEALRYFNQSASLGGQERDYLAQRALAYDLAGDHARAQFDYRQALAVRPGDAEVTRNYALSLGFVGDPDNAIRLLTPLLQAQDRAAWRARAFILAMNGRTAEAVKIVDSTMPASLAVGIKPYLAQMNRLNPAQKAAAVHLGRFPTTPLPAAIRPSATQVAAVAPKKAASSKSSRRRDRENRAGSLLTAPRATSRIAVAPTQPQREPARQPVPATAPAPARAQIRPPIVLASSHLPIPDTVRAAEMRSAQQRGHPGGALVSVPTNVLADPTTKKTVPSNTPIVRLATQISVPVTGVATPVSTPADPVPTANNSAALQGPSIAVTGVAPAVASPPPGRSLADIVGSIDLNAESAGSSASALNAGELDQIRQDRLKAQTAEAARAKAATDDAARVKAAAKASALADAKKKADVVAKAANPARHWVQLAVGDNVSALGFDYRKFAKKHPDAFKGQSGWTAEYGQTRRLVVGPFKTAKDAKTWEADYRKAGGDGLATATTDGQEVAKLPAR